MNTSRFIKFIFSIGVTFLNILFSLIFTWIVYKSDMSLIKFYAFTLSLFSLFSIFEMGFSQRYISLMNCIEGFNNCSKPIIYYQIVLSFLVLTYIGLSLDLIFVCLALIFRSLCILLYNKVLFEGNYFVELTSRFCLSSSFQLILIIFLLANVKLNTFVFSISILISYFILFIYLFNKEKVFFKFKIELYLLKSLELKFFLLNFCSFFLFTIPIVLYKALPNNFYIKFTLFLQMLNISVQLSSVLKPFFYNRWKKISSKSFKKEVLKYSLVLIVLFSVFFILFKLYNNDIYNILKLNIPKDDFIVLGDIKFLIIICFELIVGLTVFHKLKIGVGLFWLTSLICCILTFINYWLNRLDFDLFTSLSLIIYIFTLYIPNFVISMKMKTNL